MTNEKAHAQMEGLATLLVLNDEIRKVTNLREFGFFTTNETHRLIPYHTAFLWKLKDPIGIELLTQSGTPEVDNHAIANQWLKEKIKEITASSSANKIHQIDIVESEMNKKVQQKSSQWTEALFPNYLLWCPLFNKSNDITGGIILLRDTPFSEAEIKMIGWLISSYQYTWKTFIKHKKIEIVKVLKKKPVIIIICAIFLFPIHLSVLGNATVVPRDPILINAPIEGVIKSFAVSPGQQVQAGQLLFTMDKTDLESNTDVSRKELMLTQAKLRTAVNQGIDNEQISAEVPILKAQLAIDSARIAYNNALLEKTKVISPISGVVVFDSKEDWVGQPVRTGERILVVSDPKRVELKIMLPITNVIELKTGDDGDFYLYGDLRSTPVKLKTLGYNAKLMPNKILAYELSADFINTANPPQLGAQGTVRLYGHRVPLIYYLLRRPIEAVRQSFGI